MKRHSINILSFLLIVFITAAGIPVPSAAATVAVAPEISSPSALLMDAASGRILFEKNAHEKLQPASVTKIMVMLLTMEAIESERLTVDTVITASERAASMGGSQRFLEAGEKMTLHDLLKSVAVSSANDACVAIGEHIAGSETGFIDMMNRRATELGMEETHFVNCTGLDAPGHLTTANDIALMSRELLRHGLIREYTTIWMDTVRDGAFGLSNTNKLVRFYDGTTGLKTGFTSSAGYCVSATAMRDGMELISVIMKGETSPKRNADASGLLNFGFANYTLIRPDEDMVIHPVPVSRGLSDAVDAVLSKDASIVVERSNASKIVKNLTLFDSVSAPVEIGQTLGYYTVTLGNEELLRVPVVAGSSVDKKSFFGIYGDLFKGLFNQ